MSEDHSEAAKARGAEEDPRSGGALAAEASRLRPIWNRRPVKAGRAILLLASAAIASPIPEFPDAA